MTVLWPGYLLAAGLIPIILAIYIWMLRRRQRYAVRYSSLSLVRAALPRASRFRRHLPFVLFLLALTSLIVALSRPAAYVGVPSGKATIMLTLDVSRSMCSTDILPNRLRAAQDAALSFIRSQEPSTQIGIVAFAGFAELVQAPTSDQEALQTAVEGLTTGRRTGIGAGILQSVDAIAEIDSGIAPSSTDLGSGEPALPQTGGSAVPHIIVLLTDGVSNTGPLPLEAAQQAQARGIRIYTIGFGSQDGSFMDCSGQFSGSGFFGDRFGGGTFGSGFRRGIDEATLIQVADLTGGTYYSATSANELQKVFKDLPTHFMIKLETMEISVAFAAAGAVLAAAAILLSMLWHPLP